MLIAALVEVVSLGAVLPFLGILTVPEKVFAYPIVADVAEYLEIHTADEMVLPLTILFVAAALMAGAIRIILLWASTRVSFSTGSDLSVEAYRRTLYQPYCVHVVRNSSEVISGIVSKMGTASVVVNQSLVLISSTVLVISILLVLIAINPVIALLSFLCFGSFYGVATWLSRRKLRHNSKRIDQDSTEALKVLQEGLGGIRDVLLDGTQPLYCETYSKSEISLRKAQGNSIFIAGSPRFALESLGMTLIAILAYIYSLQPNGLLAVLPVLGALALGAQRLLPSLQQIFAAWAGITAHRDSLIAVLDLLDQVLPSITSSSTPDALNFKRTIVFDSVQFRYTDESLWVLDGLKLTIPKGARVGFVGSTGSGKSTTLDLLMGLLEPVHGQILVDDEPINGDRRYAWQQTVAHVPQSIYLSDTSLAGNIAFGIKPKDIDFERVQFAAEQAQIADFIESCPKGYETYVGERGVRLSGGQRQRIGIARSLYKRASVLVFDEATSALDNATEKAVMEAIQGLDRGLTILLIAHRLSTVQSCDIIFELEDGRVVAQGSYDQLIENSSTFRQMASAVA